MASVRPYVGCPMWYYPPRRAEEDQPWLAFVAYVWDEHKVNLTIFDNNGQQFLGRGRSVRLVQEGEAAPVSGEAYCTFIPQARE